MQLKGETMSNNGNRRNNTNSRDNVKNRREQSRKTQQQDVRSRNSENNSRRTKEHEKESGQSTHTTTSSKSNHSTPPVPPGNNRKNNQGPPEQPNPSGNIGDSSYFSTDNSLSTINDVYGGGILGEFRNLDEDLIDAIIHTPEQTVQNSDLYQGSRRIYNTYEATLGYASAQMAYDTAKDSFQSHINEIDTLGINKILDESIGGQISFSNTFDNLEAANFIQQNGTSVHLFDNNSNNTDTISFQNELIYSPSEQSYLLDRIIRGETITFYSSDKREDISINSSTIQVLGDNGREISLQEYGQNLSRAYKGKSKDEVTELKKQFEDDFNKLALHQVTFTTDDMGQKIAEQVFYGASVDTDMSYLDNIGMYLGGHSTSDVTKPFKDFVGNKERHNNIKINIGGGVDLDGTSGRITKTNSSAFASLKANTDNITTSYLNGSNQRTMTEEAFSFANKGQTGKGRNLYNISLQSSILDREKEQYVEYLSHHLNVDLATRLTQHDGIKSLGRNYCLLSPEQQKRELEKSMVKAGVSMSDIKKEDTQKVLDAFISANNTQYKLDRAKRSRKRSSSSFDGFKEQLLSDSDLYQGWNRINSTVRNGKRLANLSYTAVYGAVGIVPMQKKLIEGTVSDIAAGKNFKEIKTNRTIIRETQRKEWNNKGLRGANKRRLERREQRRANIRAVGRTTGRAIGNAVATSAPVSWVGNTRVGKMAKNAKTFATKHFVSPIKKTIKSIEKFFTNFFDLTSKVKFIIIAGLLVFALVFMIIPIIAANAILNQVTSSPAAVFMNADSAEFSSLCDEISDKINTYAINQQNTYVNQVKTDFGLEEDAITIHYSDKSGMFDYTCSVTDPIPLEYLNIKQTIVAMDLTASGFYSVSYGGEGDDSEEGISDSQAVRLCKDIYKNTHWSSYTTTTDEDGNVIAADIYCVVELAAASVYPSDTDSVNYIGGPLYQAHNSSVNNNWLDYHKIDYYEQDLLMFYDNIMTTSWEDSFDMPGYDLDVNGWHGTILNTEYSSDDGSGMLWGEYSGTPLSEAEINSIIATLTELGYSDRQLATALFCLQAVGCPYNQSLRMNPGVYDCSSLAARSWDSAGFSDLIVSNWAMTAAGEYVYLRDCGKSLADDSNLQPGDLIFYTNNPDRELGIGHVSVYIGEIDGKKMLVSAAGTAYGVIYQEYLGDGIYFARP